MPTLQVRSCARILDSLVDAVWASDHFGVIADLAARSRAGVVGQR